MWGAFSGTTCTPQVVLCLQCKAARSSSNAHDKHTGLMNAYTQGLERSHSLLNSRVRASLFCTRAVPGYKLKHGGRQFLCANNIPEHWSGSVRELLLWMRGVVKCPVPVHQFYHAGRLCVLVLVHMLLTKLRQGVMSRGGHLRYLNSFCPLCLLPTST